MSEPPALLATRLQTPDGWITVYVETPAAREALHALAAHHESFPTGASFYLRLPDDGPSLRITARDGGPPGRARERLEPFLHAGREFYDRTLVRLPGFAADVYATQDTAERTARRVSRVLELARDLSRLRHFQLRKEEGAYPHTRAMFSADVWLYSGHEEALQTTFLAPGVICDPTGGKPPAPETLDE